MKLENVGIFATCALNGEVEGRSDDNNETQCLTPTTRPTDREFFQRTEHFSPQVWKLTKSESEREGICDLCGLREIVKVM